MDKKGYVFIPMLEVLTFFIFGYALLLFATEDREQPTKTLGKLQSDSLELISETEQELLNLDNIGRYAGYRTLVKLGEIGGVEGDNVWDKNPYENLKIVLDKIYKKEFKDYLQKTEVKDIDHDFFYNIDKLLSIEGLAKKDIIKEKDRVKYLIKPNFKVILDYDLGIYDRLYYRYYDWGKDKKCKEKEEVFEGFNVRCNEDNEFLNFEVVTKDLGHVQPKIIFKIRKSGELFGK